MGDLSGNGAAVSRKRELSVREAGLIIAFNLLFFQSPLQSVFSPFAYIDEGLVLWYLGLSLLGRKGTTEKHEWAALACMAGVSVIGLFSNALFPMQSAAPILIDLMTCNKFLLIYLTVVRQPGSVSRCFSFLEKELKVIVLLALAFLFLHYLNVDFGMGGNDLRYGLRSFRFVFPHPTYLVGGMIGAIAIFSLRFKENRGFIAAALLLIASSTRSKALGFVLIYVSLYTITAFKGKLRLWQVTLAGLLAIWAAWGQIEFYFLRTMEAARMALQMTSFTIANQFFPWGSGFATFGSYMSGVYYSPMYYRYGLHTVYGLTRDNTSFLSDTFWPTVIAQFGWIGLVLFLGMLLFLLGSVRKRFRQAPSLVLPILTIIIYLMISSTSEAGFFNMLAVFWAFVMGVVVRKGGEGEVWGRS